MNKVRNPLKPAAHSDHFQAHFQIRKYSGYTGGTRQAAGMMMRPRGDVPVYLHRLPVDFRKAINGLSVIVQDEFTLDPYSESLFVFVNKTRNRVKLLY